MPNILPANAEVYFNPLIKKYIFPLIKIPSNNNFKIILGSNKIFLSSSRNLKIHIKINKKPPDKNLTALLFTVSK